jgi:hypothetical protein
MKDGTRIFIVLSTEPTTRPYIENPNPFQIILLLCITNNVTFITWTNISKVTSLQNF